MVKPKITYWSNGQKKYEEYYLDDVRHREDGPAFQSWYENGQKKFEEYFLNDKYYSKKGWLIKIRKLKLIKING